MSNTDVVSRMIHPEAVCSSVQAARGGYALGVSFEVTTGSKEFELLPTKAVTAESAAPRSPRFQSNNGWNTPRML